MPNMDKLNNDVTTDFCHFVFFFDSKSVAEQWIAEHPGTFLLSLEDAFLIGKEVNAARYNLSLLIEDNDDNEYKNNRNDL